ncbi:MAG: hypothetical protein SFU85_00395 [Candidatus Methylacidiphilales bacterium]|nr:hypothetical protein [Candidatus Methylacidiphilales bacterium]
MLVFLAGSVLAGWIIACGPARLRQPAGWLVFLLLVQVVLGTATTLAALGHIPVVLGSLHQLNALLILALGLYLQKQATI